MFNFDSEFFFHPRIRTSGNRESRSYRSVVYLKSFEVTCKHSPTLIFPLFTIV